MFVVLREKEPASATDRRWWQWVKQALEPFERDVTVLVYTLASLRHVANWYVLRLAQEGSLVYDRANVTGLFSQIGPWSAFRPSLAVCEGRASPDAAWQRD
ncbi:MAG: hypothetical protein HY784_09010 [Chloroflexi bacterium]|nr:hypothetical protein [Chloroflexota bacterium]